MKNGSRGPSLWLNRILSYFRLKDRLGSNSRETESGSEGFRSPEHDWDAKVSLSGVVFCHANTWSIYVGDILGKNDCNNKTLLSAKRLENWHSLGSCSLYVTKSEQAQ